MLAVLKSSYDFQHDFYLFIFFFFMWCTRKFTWMVSSLRFLKVYDFEEDFLYDVQFSILYGYL